ncbi:branched-chain amino acid ABC transporter permease [Kaustia mangrovi]|uniref:Branched-chain amino acid ABC transporter permease n=1 Tax=Kaustia mangrovi TaxID=2593653 RepID=A0A7S8C480_9HYPH|nr:branched-chain amino acid ABC transporter permease [Kaustia mangrovi]QPC43115.1 branched-chain amino acid ABC transporter permease [Kaustia mangrovi]
MLADPSTWIVQGLNGLQLSMLLFLLSVGLTVIFGLLHFVNLAHGALYALGAYAGVSAVWMLGSYWAAFVLAPAAVALAGTVLYLGLIRRMRRSGPMNQVLVTFGLIFVFLDIFRIVWGDIALGIDAPAFLSGPVEVLGVAYPAYRLFIIALGAAVMAGLGLVLSRTQIGAMIRAGVDNDRMAACLGLNVERIFFVVFCVGCALAGLAGVVAAPVFSVTPDMGTQILIPTLIVVVIGGLGSLKGAVAGSLIVGFTQTFGAVLAPQLAAVAVYALLAGILIFRPAGLFPARG